MLMPGRPPPSDKFSPFKHYATDTKPIYDKEGPGAMALNHDLVYAEMVEMAEAYLPERRVVDGKVYPRERVDALLDGIVHVYDVVFELARKTPSDLAAHLVDAYRHWSTCDMPRVKSPYGRSLGPEQTTQWHANRVRHIYDIHARDLMRQKVIGARTTTYYVEYVVRYHGVQGTADLFAVSRQTINNWLKGVFTPSDYDVLFLTAPHGTETLMRWLADRLGALQVDPRFGLTPVRVVATQYEVNRVLCEPGLWTLGGLLAMLAELQERGFTVEELPGG